uniref:Uncharacterized protein n=1 Tax=Candidatus Kentrum sp. TC TaxID=2126339 RepID=A0A450YIU7_9GAMM|nr:MAG: hypothetical protein BECKTC1821E_GA0114239_101135 [Candidatus Kentron sp. TC]
MGGYPTKTIITPWNIGVFSRYRNLLVVIGDMDPVGERSRSVVSEREGYCPRGSAQEEPKISFWNPPARSSDPSESTNIGNKHSSLPLQQRKPEIGDYYSILPIFEVNVVCVCLTYGKSWYTGVLWESILASVAPCPIILSNLV